MQVELNDDNMNLLDQYILSAGKLASKAGLPHGSVSHTTVVNVVLKSALPEAIAEMEKQIKARK